MNIIYSKIYAKIYVLIRRLFKINLPGLGFLLRRIKVDSTMKFRGRVMFLNHKVASSYGLHVIGLPQENETHIFLDYLLKDFDDPFSFVDVGANIGAFLIDVSRKPNSHIYGFEPFTECVTAIEKSLKFNVVKNYTLFNNLVGDINTDVYFDQSCDPEGASYYNNSSTKKIY